MTIISNPRKKRVVTAISVLSALVLGMTGCATSIPAGQVGLVVDGYIMIPTDPKIKGCIDPEKSQIEMTNDVYRYPARQISWDATGAEGSERAPYRVVSSIDAPAEVDVPVIVTFDLTTDCDMLSEFHREFGTKYSGWLNSDGTTSDGWVALLNYVVGQPLEQTILPIAQKYTWQKIWNDEEARTEFQRALLTQLPKASKARTNGKEFFTNFQVTVLKPDPVDDGLKDAIVNEQQGIAEANARKAAAEAAIAAAEAQTRQADQEALKKQSEISGYPSVESYLRAQAVEKGLNPWQPTYVVPQQVGGN